MSRYAIPSDYARLGLPLAATAAEIKTAFRRMAMQMHPDHNPGDPDATKKFKQLADSYEACLKGQAPPPNSIAGREAARAAVRARAQAAGEHGHETMPPQVPVYSPMTHRARRAAEQVDRPLAALRIGDVVWADYSAILVGADRACYLDPSAIGRPHVDRGTQVRVERGGAGFHVEIPSHCRYRWGISPRASIVGLAVTTLGLGDVTAPADGANALLPGRFIDATVARMGNGQRGWTVAQALVVLSDGSILINGDEQVSPSPTLTTPVRVERRADGFHVMAPGRPSQWMAQERIPGHNHIAVSTAQLGGIDVAPPRAAYN